MPVKAFVFDAYGTLFDTRSLKSAVEREFPREAEFVTEVWRQKQLEYSWLRTAMGLRAGFATVTRDALLYALGTVGLEPPEPTLAALCAAFDRLQPYPEVAEALDGLEGRRLAVLSNGSPAMLAALLDHAGLARHFEAVVSTDSTGRFKPHPDVYRAVTEALGLSPHEVLLVSSNGFDIAGANHFGLLTARIERLPPLRLRAAIDGQTAFSPSLMMSVLRSQADTFAGAPTLICSDLLDLKAKVCSAAFSQPTP